MAVNWPLKHAPKTFGAVVHHDAVKFRLQTMKHPMHMLFYGPPGTGKTSLARLLAKHLDYPYLYIDYNEENWEEAMTKMTTFQMSSSLTHPHITKKIVIIDNLNNADSSIRQRFLYTLAKSCFLFFISNHCHHLVPMLRSQMIEIFLSRIPPEKIRAEVDRLCALEETPRPSFVNVPTSMRQAIFCAQSQRTLPEPDDLPWEMQIQNLTGLEATTKLLSNHPTPEVAYCSAYKHDTDLLAAILEIEFGKCTSLPLLAITLLLHKGKNSVGENERREPAVVQCKAPRGSHTITEKAPPNALQ